MSHNNLYNTLFYGIVNIVNDVCKKMENKTKRLLQKALKTHYYNNLWKDISIDSPLKFETLPLSDKSLFNSKNITNSLSVNSNKISQYYFSSGTTGDPKIFPFTNQDWTKRTKYRKKCYELIGITKKDKVIIMLPFGPWIAGPLAQAALMSIKCTVFPVGDLSEKEEIKGLFQIIKNNNINVIVTAPSFLEKFLSVYTKLNETFSIEKIVTSGEYISKESKRDAFLLLGAKTYSSYATSETFMGIECENENGFHYNPKEVKIEIINKNGKIGSIVVTVFSSDAVPIIRYKIDDIGFIEKKPCSCGIKWPRINWKGRASEVFAVAGAVNVGSKQVHDIISKSELMISGCDIEINDDKNKGNDLVKFTFFTPTTPSYWPKNIKKKLKSLIENMSIDFKDVVHHNIVKVKVDIIFHKKNTKRIKKIIRIEDKRKNVR